MDRGWYFFHVGAEEEHAVEAVLRGIPTFELIQPERNKFFFQFHNLKEGGLRNKIFDTTTFVTTKTN
jgi:hypothetical protein